jgi:hypothetical protein
LLSQKRKNQQMIVIIQNWDFISYYVYTMAAVSIEK